MRNSAEIWKEEERLNDLGEKLTSGRKIGFIKVDDEIVNSVDIIGIFSAQTMEDRVRRQNGEWKCGYDIWHKRGEKCDCGDFKIPDYAREYCNEDGTPKINNIKK